MFGRMAIQRRALGTVTRGPKLRDVGANWNKAMELFCKPALGYWEFQQRCSSLRLFVFWGTVSYLTVDLIANPPRSSYWLQWNIWRWPVNIYNALTKSSDNIFNASKTRDIDVPAAYAFLIANRRMPDEPSHNQ